MSQRECAGFNAPRFSVEAWEDVEIAPRTCLLSGLPWGLLERLAIIPGDPCSDLISLAVGVAQPTSATVFLLLSVFPASLFPFLAGVPAIGVGHPASRATAARFGVKSFRVCGVSLFASGVGHPPKPLPDMRRADARSAQIGSRNGISHVFQVSEYSREPLTSKLACNLLAKDRCRAALADEP
ncbi:MAG TPA: hypothetical protein VNQ90_17760 [Chthoniobacteraceae bacterium]|nr:hypothetical protein [Chthoniobacteraceae bacterium]